MLLGDYIFISFYLSISYYFHHKSFASKRTVSRGDFCTYNENGLQITLGPPALS